MSVTAFSRADGFFAIAEDREFAAEGDRIAVTPLGSGSRHADLADHGVAGHDSVRSRQGCELASAGQQSVGERFGVRESVALYESALLGPERRLRR